MKHEVDSPRPNTNWADKPRPTTVVTGFHPAGYTLYGNNFLKTFEKYWPEHVGLIFYTEEPCGWTGRGTERSLWSIPGVREFINTHDHPKYHGKDPLPQWTKKEIHVGESWRYDAVKFCKQLFIPDHAAQGLPDGTILTWFDGDVVTFADVPDHLIHDLVGPYDLVTIGRDRGQTDIGFWAIVLNPETRNMLSDIAESYRNGFVLKLPEWHSGYLFDHWKDKYKAEGKITHKSLTKGNGHVWFQCEIGKYTDHLKGPARKALGKSPERFGVSMKALRV